MLALDANLHVLCEKPLTTTLADAARLVQRTRRSDRTVMVGHNFRFLPQFSQLQQRVKAGAIGEPFLAESSYIQNLYAIAGRGPAYWRLRDPQDFYLGGAVHNVDLLRWVAGEIVEVHSYAKHIMPFYGLDDNYVSNLRFASGAIGRLALVLGARLKDKFQLDLRVYGAEGALKSSLARSEVEEDADHLAGDKPRLSPVEPADAIALEVAHFVHAIRSGQPPLCDVVEGAKNVGVCLAAIQSAQSGQPVIVDYGFLA
jgi:predicted dehydrogenase